LTIARNSLAGGAVESLEASAGHPPTTPRPFRRWRSVAKLLLGMVLVVISVVFGYQYGMEVRPSGGGTISVSDAGRCLDEGADLYFNVTLGTEAYLKRLGEWDKVKDRQNTTQVFVLSANTHVGAITDLRLDNNLLLHAGGRQYPAVGKTLATTKHHNTYLAFFPNRGMNGEPLFEGASGTFRVIIQNVGKLKSRIFTFSLPLPAQRGAIPLDWTQILMLVGATLAALLISCTPCMVGTLALGSITMGSGWSGSDVATAAEVRRAMMRKTAYFLGATAGGYLLIAVAVAEFGVGVADLRPIEIVGGVVLAGVGLSLLRGLRPVSWLTTRARALLPTRLVVEPEDDAGTVGAATSSAMGGSLAMLCSVAGAPTLAMSIVVPVMIYAGMGSLTWAFIILAVFLLISAVPFFLIATGLGEIIYSISTRWRGRLLFVNSILLMTLGTVMIINGDNVANVISAPAELVLDGWRWIAR
jgi:hypothetical protein